MMQRFGLRARVNDGDMFSGVMAECSRGEYVLHSEAEGLEQRLRETQRYADYAARQRIEQGVTYRAGGWMDLYLAGPLLALDMAYMRSRGLIKKHPKKAAWFKLADQE